MMLAPRLVTAPASDPVTLAQVKAHLRIDHTDDDTILGVFIKAAIGYLDGWYGIAHRALVTQTWLDSYGHFETEMRLSVGPVVSVTSVIYETTGFTDETLSNSLYSLLEDPRGHFIAPKPGITWPPVSDRRDAIRIQYVAGTAVESVPPAIIAALLLIVGDLYAHRETVSAANIAHIPSAATVDMLLNPFRRTIIA